MPEPFADEDVVPPADPFEAELVAYLDGELDPVSARRVEARLATDQQARARATALKKTFDLLDYLPKPEPSATFTSRTLDKLPALQQALPQPRTSRASQPVAVVAPQTSAPALPSPSALKISTLTGQSRNWVLLAAILAAAMVFAAVGYFGTTAIRSRHGSEQSAKDIAEELTLSDRRLVENLPLYSVVDNYAFVNDLAKPEYFGNEPNVAYNQALKLPSSPPETLTADSFASLEKSFKVLPHKRQQEIRDLDKQLHEAPPAQRDRLLRALEVYAAWLGHLSETDRKRILTAAAPSLRLDQIRDIRDKQWVETLPSSYQNLLKNVPSADLRRRFIEEWKADEIRRREEWATARKNPADTLDPRKIPWPFDNEIRRNEILTFARTAFALDDPKGSRLTANESERYQTALNSAQLDGGAVWYIYGKTVYELLKKKEEFLLPPPAESKYRYATIQELPEAFHELTSKASIKKRLDPLVGKWPEFPLELHREIPPKTALKYTLPPLGPARVSEFTPLVRTFIENEMLNSKLTSEERKRLQEREGKWPEYSRELIQLAQDHDLSIPGVMLPGPPKQWDAFYGSGRNK